MKGRIVEISKEDGFKNWKSMIGKTGEFYPYKKGNSQPGYQCGTFHFDKKLPKLHDKSIFFHAIKVEEIENELP